jgi:hypothetical protein
VRPGEIVEQSVVASPSSRASLFGSAGKEAIVAPSGVVLNAAKKHASKSGRPWVTTEGTVVPRSSQRSYDKTEHAGVA